MPQESLNNITTSIASHFDKEQDEPFKRMLSVKVDAWRSKLVTNSLEKHPEQRKFFKQTIWIPMQSVQPVPCPVPMVLCPVAKSKMPLPRPMRIGGTLFDYVGGIDGSSPFMEAAPGTIDYLKAGKYSKNITFYEYENLYMKVASNSKLPAIRVDGIFDKPIDVMALNCANTNAACDFWNDPYPVTGDILQMIIQYILQVDFNRPNTPDNHDIEVDPTKPKTPNNK